MKCFWQGSTVNPDAGWHANEQAMKENPLYNFMDIKMGGSVVETFEDHGAEGLRNLCVSQIQFSYLYNSGQGRVIRLKDYEQWRCSTDETVNAGEGFDVNRFVRFKDHTACWDLTKRGVLGETILHLCYHNNTPIHNEIARVLLQLYPKLALDIVEKEERYGESALHLAIVNGDLDSVKLLVQCGANVNQPATGKFFLPEDQMKRRTKKTDYVGYAYYGEYPLSFAACFGHDSIYDYLLRNGADPNLQDSYGNTVLHMLIISNQLDMYSYAVRHPLKPANTWIKNGLPGSDGLTPLALASKLGRQHIFNQIMELHRIELWRFSNVGCSLYPLHAVDSIGIGGVTNWNSALMIVVNGETDDHLEMLQGGVIRQLLDEKWKTFVRTLFFQRLLLLLLHLILLTSAIYLRPSHDLVGYDSYQDGIRFACEIIVVLGCIGIFLMHIEEVKALGFYLFIINLKNAPSKAVFLMSCLLVICCLPIRCAHMASDIRNGTRNETDDHDSKGTVHPLQLVEETMLIIAVPCAWCMLLFFAKGHSLTGTSVMMFYKILMGDTVRFVIIYFNFLVCFSQAFYFLYKDVRPTDAGEITSFGTPIDTLMSLVHMTFGEFNYIHFDYTTYPWLTKFVFMAFMLYMPILLLNMLIAMMGNTYMNIIAKSEKEWVRQWAKIVMVLERTYSKDALLNFQNQYSMPVDSPPKVDAEHLSDQHGNEKVDYRALMVIKTSSKTMAKQRKDAITYWKWMLKETLQLIREVRRSGFQSEIGFRHLFPDANEFSLFDHSLLRAKATGNGEPNWTAAVHQLAWEKDLNLSTGGSSIKQMQDGLRPINNVQTSAEYEQPIVSGPSTERTAMEMDYINDDELEAIIQHAEDYRVKSPIGDTSADSGQSQTDPVPPSHTTTLHSDT